MYWAAFVRQAVRGIWRLHTMSHATATVSR
jgi:hypothetical protein